MRKLGASCRIALASTVSWTCNYLLMVWSESNKGVKIRRLEWKFDVLKLPIHIVNRKSGYRRLSGICNICIEIGSSRS